MKLPLVVQGFAFRNTGQSRHFQQRRIGDLFKFQSFRGKPMVIVHLGKEKENKSRIKLAENSSESSGASTFVTANIVSSDIGKLRITFGLNWSNLCCPDYWLSLLVLGRGKENKLFTCGTCEISPAEETKETLFTDKGHREQRNTSFTLRSTSKSGSLISVTVDGRSYSNC
uniref:Uncharacterized protein n=1 Tax=Solanum lycopersicum TaxID=4081 RepID=A0A3Q7GAP5_SOLLC